jgi:ABC-type proline/glycine betaine transport system ATPase subunit
MQTVFHPVDLQKTQWERKRNREESLVPLISIESQQRSIRFPIEISG